jgi:5-methylcytosine-specific restriction endonuclease McrA
MIHPALRVHYNEEYENAKITVLARAEGLCEMCGRIGVQLGVAHLNHLPWDHGYENLAALCRGCHLEWDRGQHKVSRVYLKDMRRPLLMLMVERYAIVHAPPWFKRAVDEGRIVA